jgi:NADP-dependent 3-hydroxy acid dehydrogenase YdfG
VDHGSLLRDRALADASARIILSARRKEALEEVQRSCGTAEVRLIPFDLSDLDVIPARAVWKARFSRSRLVAGECRSKR